MNVETEVDKNDEILYCCCDNNPTCASKSTFYNNANDCADQCDIFFLLSLSDENAEFHSFSTIKGTIIDSPPQSLYGYTFSFGLDDIPFLVRCIATLQKVCNFNDFETIYMNVIVLVLTFV